MNLRTNFPHSLIPYLHRVDGALVVLAGILEIFLLLLDAFLDLGADLGHFHLSAKHLTLLSFKGSFGLIQSMLNRNL